MVSISLNKTEYYKDDWYATGKAQLTGSITGLDSSKQYCIMWYCTYCEYQLFHGPTYEYFFISGVSSILIPTGSHLHASYINSNNKWEPGNYANVVITVNQVNGNCETVTSPNVAHTNIKIYNYNVATTGIIKCSSDPSWAEIWMDNVVGGDLVYKGLTGSSINPTIIADVHLGITDVEFRKTGYDTCYGTFFVEAGQTYDVNCTLTKISKINTSITFDHWSDGKIVTEIVLGKELKVIGKLNGASPNIKTLKLYSNSYFAGYITTNIYGYFETLLSIISAGTYNNKIVFEGDEDYNSSELSKTIIVKESTKINTLIGLTKNPNKSLYYDGETVLITAKLTSASNPQPPNGTPIKFYEVNQNGDEIFIATVNTVMGTGQAPLEYIINTISTTQIEQKIVAKFEGNINYKPSQQFITFNILAKPILKGTLSCTSVPTGAGIYLNNIYQGITNKDISNLEPGNYNVKFTKDGYNDFTKTVTITAEVTTYVTATLINIKECIDYTTKATCEANGCYWWSNNTCQSAPEGTTETFDVYVKPYPWYNGKYEDAISDTLKLVTDLGGKIANYITSITGYEYKGIDIFEDANKKVIIVRVYLKDTGETTLVIPVPVIAIIVGIIAGVLIYTIGYITGTSSSDWTNEKVIKEFDEACDKAIIVCKERYPNRLTNVNEAKGYKDCVGGVDTVRAIGGSDVADEDPTDAIDIIDAGVKYLGDGLDDGSILPEDIDKEVDKRITTPIKKLVDDWLAKVKEEDCAWEIAGTCIISKQSLKTLTWVGIGLGGLFALSTVKSLTKR